ncbi:MAG TPA: RsmD family RNA methyltransferase [Candidatus Saccharimonadales bacterium]|nr:RsmD family RNA methyltransferase [Candidatus Saccharimonadales bacterium]
MRIIAGRLGGRSFDSPHGHRTHPMSDRVRGGLFNSLGDINGLTVLDAFAGSGALSFEALSRGAQSAIAIDIDKKAHDTIKKNASSLGLNHQIKITRANASGWSDNNPDQTFDIVIAAPPYDDLQFQLVEKLARHVGPDGLLVLDWPGAQAVPAFENFYEVAQRRYGDAQLIFYKR